MGVSGTLPLALPLRNLMIYSEEDQNQIQVESKSCAV